MKIALLILGNLLVATLPVFIVSCSVPRPPDPIDAACARMVETSLAE